MITLKALPYEHTALEPHISSETIDYHYLKHHKTYVDNLNVFIQSDPQLQNKSLEEIVRSAPAGPIFNNAAQVWNHDFYWDCLSPQGGGEPEGLLKAWIERDFESVERFKTLFSDVALKTFGSGWAWLVLTEEKKLKIISTSNAQTPLTTQDWPLLTCDVWEHAYYIDYRNARAQYVQSFWKCVNWSFVQSRLERA